MLEKVIAIIASYTEVPACEITENSVLESELGISSIDFVAIIMDFEDEFGVTLPEEQLKSIKTVGDIVGILG